jgi:hypothetical protein
MSAPPPSGRIACEALIGFEDGTYGGVARTDSAGDLPRSCAVGLFGEEGRDLGRQITAVRRFAHALRLACWFHFLHHLLTPSRAVGRSCRLALEVMTTLGYVTRRR